MIIDLLQQPQATTQSVVVFEDRCAITHSIVVAAGEHSLSLAGLSPLLTEERCTVRMKTNKQLVPMVFSVSRHSQAGTVDVQTEDKRAHALAVAHAAEHASRTEQDVRTIARTLPGAWANHAWKNGLLDASFGNKLIEALQQVEAANIRTEAAKRRAQQAQQEAVSNRGAHDRPKRSTTLRCQWSAQAEPATLVITYTVPCAAWRPRHEARLVRRGTATEVEWVSQAQLWQATGETWRGRAELSTARQQNTALPSLSPDILHMTTKQAPARQVIVASREEVVAGQHSSHTQPGVDDGGEARRFTIDQVAIAPNGRAQRVKLHEHVVPATLQWVCVPDQVLAVQAMVGFKHEGVQPLLAGPVLTHLGQQCMGTTIMPLVASGQQTELCFGSDDGFEVSYERTAMVQERMLQATVRHLIQTVTITSRSGDVRAITVCLRIPVSEIDRLKVVPSPQHSTVEWRADAQGMVKIAVEIRPGERKSLAIAFTLDAANDVVLPHLW
jgi:uncharacterized protein (TIGR02231 family)